MQRHQLPECSAQDQVVAVLPQEPVVALLLVARHLQVAEVLVTAEQPGVVVVQLVVPAAVVPVAVLVEAPVVVLAEGEELPAVVEAPQVAVVLQAPVVVVQPLPVWPPHAQHLHPLKERRVELQEEQPLQDGFPHGLS
jgi:hypothetical protein